VIVLPTRKRIPIRKILLNIGRIWAGWLDLKTNTYVRIDRVG